MASHGPSGSYLAWLAVVNTALAFTLFAHTQKVLAPFETSALNHTMLVQIALLSWLLLGDELSGGKLAGVLLAAVGPYLVQGGPSLTRWRHGKAAPVMADRGG